MEAIIKKNCKLCHQYHNAANSAMKDTLRIGYFRLRDEAVNRALKGIKVFCDEVHNDEDSIFMGRRSAVFEHTENMKRECVECDSKSPLLYKLWDDKYQELASKWADKFNDLKFKEKDDLADFEDAERLY